MTDIYNHYDCLASTIKQYIMILAKFRIAIYDSNKVCCKLKQTSKFMIIPHAIG